jgi:hypothetical protein
MRPSPTTPTVLPKSSVPENDERFQVCWRNDASAAGAVDVRGRRVDHQDSAGGGRVHVDVVEADAGAGDDLELRAGVEDVGVDGGGRADQQRVGLGHRGQQLFSVWTVHPADVYLVTKCGDGGFGEFVSDQHNGQAHPASLMGLT